MSRKIFVLLLFVSIGLSITVEYQLHRGWQLLGVPCTTMTGRISDYLPIYSH